jgi:hypothetical protein
MQLVYAELDRLLQIELSDLLAQNGESELPPEKEQRCDELMLIYRQGLLLKAEALKVAVERKLIPPLGAT